MFSLLLYFSTEKMRMFKKVCFSYNNLFINVALLCTFSYILDRTLAKNDQMRSIPLTLF